ncbi:MAG: DUF5791 family protein [Halobacteriaceae archaeon]
MLAEEIGAETTPGELLADYRRRLAAVVDDPSAVAAATGLAESRLAAAADGDPSDPPLTVAEAAAVLATDDRYPDAEAIELEVRDALLLEMSTAVLDVEAVAAAVDGLDATAVHQKIEGRRDMTLSEYARVKHAVASGGP